MKYKGTIAVDEVNGSAGNVTGSRAKGRKYLKNKPIPTNNRTSKQQEVRGSFSSNSRTFKGLEMGVAEAWNEAAKLQLGRSIFGEKAGISGINLFQRVNQNIQIAGGTKVTVPPTVDVVEFPVIELIGLDLYNTVQYQGGSTTQYAIVANEFTLPAGLAIVVRTTPVIVGNRRNIRSSLSILTNTTEIVQILSSAEGNLYEKAVTAIYFEDVYPSRELVPGINDRIAVELYMIQKSSGVVSAKFFIDTAITNKIPLKTV